MIKRVTLPYSFELHAELVNSQSHAVTVELATNSCSVDLQILESVILNRQRDGSFESADVS